MWPVVINMRTKVGKAHQARLQERLRALRSIEKMATQNKPLIILKHIGQDKRIYQQMQDNSWWSNRVEKKIV